MNTTTTVRDMRQPAFDIDPAAVNRWSPRSYLDKPVLDDKLNSLFEAARWAPSLFNWQPWRFIVARTPKDRERFYSFINERNRIWCEKAPALALIISKKTSEQGDPNPTHAFDTGSAWGILALEAVRQGLATHPMGGYDKAKAREVLQIPDDYELHIVFTIGYQGPKEALPEGLAERETPSGRRDMKESVFEGSFGKVY